MSNYQSLELFGLVYVDCFPFFFRICFFRPASLFSGEKFGRYLRFLLTEDWLAEFITAFAYLSIYVSIHN